MKTQEAVEHLMAELQADPDFARAWQSNIAMPIYDGARGKITHRHANEIADRLMLHLFKVKMPPNPHVADDTARPSRMPEV